MAISKDVKEYASVAFLLLGVLFGMTIMTYIFGQLGPQNSGLTVADPGYNESLQVQNNSLQSIVTYTAQSSTQFTTLAIAITLVVLIGLFLLFWNIFVSKKKSKSNAGSSGNFMG